MNIQFRPHHFLCALCFQGSGYSPAFITNFQAIMDYLAVPNGDEVPIQIVKHTDSICEPCPHRVEKSCTSQEKITKLDNAHAHALQIEDINTITWGDAKKRIKENISLSTFHNICNGCEWKAFGICEGVLFSR